MRHGSGEGCVPDLGHPFNPSSRCIHAPKAKSLKGGTRCPHRVLERTLLRQPVEDNGLHLELPTSRLRWDNRVADRHAGHGVSR